MVIVAGHITVDPEQRESYIAGCMSVVEKALRADGCLDFAIMADLLDPGRVNLFERWESQAAVDTFRRSGPSKKARRGNALGVGSRVRDRRRAALVRKTHWRGTEAIEDVVRARTGQVLVVEAPAPGVGWP